MSVVSASSWTPFGPISSYTLGGINRPVTRSYDANYAVSAINAIGFALSLTRDPMGNITGEGNGAESYTPDALGRLTRINQGSTSIETLTYNPTGDRLSKTGGGGYATGAYGYKTATHQLTSTGSYARSVDAAGNTTAATLPPGLLGLGYNGRDRLSAVTQGGKTVASYLYNAQGQRIQKTVGSAATRFDYDESGQLLAEYGAKSKDYLWFNGIPVGIVDGTGGNKPSYTVNYVLADQLNTPRAVVNAAGTTIWSWAWLGNPFGEKAPSSTGGYVLNLRYPGQYFDAETGLSQNGFRTYDPATGRYLQSDPLGLWGGQWSTYAYAGGNSLNKIDPLGLQVVDPNEETSEEAEEINPKLGPNPGLAPPETQYQRENREGICRRNSLPSGNGNLGHIFDPNKPGHLPNIPENQQLLENVANNPDNEIGTDSRGLTWYAEMLPDGSQVWVSTRNGVIQNGGVNQVPRDYNAQTGLSSPFKPRR